MNERLENEKISKLLWSLALPSILAQLTTLIYNMVDRIFIGRLPDGALAIAGIGLCASIITIITAFTNLFGRGGAPLASIKLGEKRIDIAEKILGNCLVSFIYLLFDYGSIIFFFFFYLVKIFYCYLEQVKTPYAMDYEYLFDWNNFVPVKCRVELFHKCTGICKIWNDDIIDWWYFKYCFRSNLLFLFSYGCCRCSSSNSIVTICLMYLGYEVLLDQSQQYKSKRTFKIRLINYEKSIRFRVFTILYEFNRRYLTSLF